MVSLASIFAYGQTSSGKTFTMTGITEYTLADIFNFIQKVTNIHLRPVSDYRLFNTFASYVLAA